MTRTLIVLLIVQPHFSASIAAEPQNKVRPVNPNEVTQTILRADRIVVSNSFSEGTQPEFESAKQVDIETFANALKLKRPMHRSSCACLGSHRIRLFAADKLLLNITVHHVESVRGSLWAGNLPLSDLETWLTWFDKRGIHELRKEHERKKTRHLQQAANERKWLSAKPKGLTNAQAVGDLGLLVALGGGNSAKQKLQRQLREAYPNDIDRIRALLKWYGSGEGPWSGYALYESIPEVLLREYDFDSLSTVFASEELSAAELEGTIRLLAGSLRFRDRQSKLSRDIQRKLWNHIKGSRNKGNLSQARRVLRSVAN